MYLLGPTLPIPCGDGYMVQKPNAQGVLLVGCEDVTKTHGPHPHPSMDQRAIKTIYELSWNEFGNDLQWSIMEQELKFARLNPFAMLVPNSYCSKYLNYQ